MLSKEASVKVKVNASFKRFLCLLLVLLMFPLDALAVVVPGGGTNIGYAGGKTTKFRFREYVGIALGIQQMQGPDYTVTRPTEKEVAAGKKGTEGLANVTRHFLYSYPNPYSPSGGQGLFYIVPKAAGAPKYVAAVSSAGVGQAPIGSNWCYASSGAFTHTKSDELFKALTSKISDQNPNPSIDPNYFNGLVAKYDKAEAEKLINYIFGRRKSNTEVDVVAINKAFDDAYRYGTNVYGKAPVLQDTRKVANYAAIILSLARLMPQENWSTYEAYVRDFVCNFASGKGYQPVVITAELCMPFEHNGNIDACTSGNAVIFCALEIYSQGEVWTLAYDGSNVNTPFKVTPDGKTYDPVVPYPSNKSPRGEEMPIVSIISINHSSKEDLDVAGTQ